MRGLHVLFSVVAQPDGPAPPTPRPSVNNADTLPTSPHTPSEQSTRRRLFSRDSRIDKARRSSTTAPPINRLVVAVSIKNPAQIRLYQVLDYPTIPRVSINRFWNLSELRKIDGLGLPAAESVRFGLYFVPGRMLVWRTPSPQSRATFLWSLLRACAEKLKRAPPVQNLLLFDLQTLADNPDQGAADQDVDVDAYDHKPATNNNSNNNNDAHINSDADPYDDDSGGARIVLREEEHRSLSNGPTSDRSALPLSLVPAHDEVPETRSDSAAGSARRSAGAPDTLSSRRASTASPGPSVLRGEAFHHSRDATPFPAPDLASASPSSASAAAAAAAAVAVANSAARFNQRADSPQRPANIALRSAQQPREVSHVASKVIRTLSEPKVSASVPKSSDSHAVTLEARQPETIAQPHISADGGGQDMNMNELVFLAARKRIAVKQSSPLCKADILEKFASVGSDPKDRTNRNRVARDPFTAKMVAERQLQQELKLFRLSADEQEDLVYALDTYMSEAPIGTLSDFGAWAEGEIQALEVENVADIVSTEETADVANGERNSGKEPDVNPFEVLVNSVQQVEPWLEKCETLLAPYASLAADINDEVILLELQRKNVLDLEAQLEELLTVINFKPIEEELISDMDSMELALEPIDANYTEFYQALEVASSKMVALSSLTSLSDMAAVAQVRQLIAEKQSHAARRVLPCLQKFLEALYVVETESNESSRVTAESVRLNTAESITANVFTEFLKGVQCLSMCGTSYFSELIDHYTFLSARWVRSVAHFVMLKKPFSVDKEAIDDHADDVLRSLFYASLGEGFRAFRLFASILAESPDRNDPNARSMPSLLRRQVPTVTFFIDTVKLVAADGNSRLQACLLLHFSYALLAFASKLETCPDRELVAIVEGIEQHIGLDTTSTSLSSLSQSASRSSYDANKTSTSLQGYDRPPPPDPSTLTRARSYPYHQYHHMQGYSAKALSRSQPVMKEILTNLIASFRHLSAQCYSQVELHVGKVMAQMTAPRDMTDRPERALFFSRVRAAVDLCREMASPLFQGGDLFDQQEDVKARTKPLCEKLIASAMRNTEMTSASAPKNCGDIVKLQCYGYIAARLSNSQERFMMQLTQLSSRVRKHVVERWTEYHIFDVVLGGFNADVLKRSSGGQVKLRERLLSLKAPAAASAMKKLVGEGMESAAETCAIVALYRELVACTKERMEEVLRHARDNKAISGLRPRLLAFSRELLAILRAELSKAEARFPSATASPS